MKSKIAAYLELIRVGNLFSAAADVLAGYYLASGLDGTSAGETSLPILLASSLCLYAGGVALNDVCDADRDAVERPERPIPSGRVSRAAATRLVVTLLGIGTIVAMTVSLRATVVAGTLVAAIALYNVHAKSSAWAPLVMGVCRALNLALGMDALPTLAVPAAIGAMLLMGLNVASVTFFARDEAGLSSKARLRLGAAGVALAVLGLCALPALFAVTRWVILFVAIPVAGFVVLVGVRAAADPTASRVQSAVRIYLVALIAFDALLAAIGAGPIAARNVALLAAPMIALTKRFRAS